MDLDEVHIQDEYFNWLQWRLNWADLSETYRKNSKTFTIVKSMTKTLYLREMNQSIDQVLSSKELRGTVYKREEKGSLGTVRCSPTPHAGKRDAIKSKKP